MCVVTIAPVIFILRKDGTQQMCVITISPLSGLTTTSLMGWPSDLRNKIAQHRLSPDRGRWALRGSWAGSLTLPPCSCTTSDQGATHEDQPPLPQVHNPEPHPRLRQPVLCAARHHQAARYCRVLYGVLAESRTLLRLPLSLPSHAASRSTFFLSWCPSPLVVQASSVD
jgi:hypothetical protein